MEKPHAYTWRLRNLNTTRSDFLKLCPKCGELKRPRSLNRRTCVSCSSKDRREWYRRNKDSQKELKARQYQKYKTRHWDEIKKRAKEWRDTHRERCNEATKRSFEKNREYYRAENTSFQSAKRASVKQATPKWRNKFFINEIYGLSKLRSKVTGYGWHVDHIVPLLSPLVCGLHVEHNLQVIPARTNIRKRNRFWPDMPKENSNR